MAQDILIMLTCNTVVGSKIGLHIVLAKHCIDLFNVSSLESCVLPSWEGFTRLLDKDHPLSAYDISFLYACFHIVAVEMFYDGLLWNWMSCMCVALEILCTQRVYYMMV